MLIGQVHNEERVACWVRIRCDDQTGDHLAHLRGRLPGQRASTHEFVTECLECPVGAGAPEHSISVQHESEAPARCFEERGAHGIGRLRELRKDICDRGRARLHEVHPVACCGRVVLGEVDRSPVGGVEFANHVIVPVSVPVVVICQRIQVCRPNATDALIAFDEVVKGSRMLRPGLLIVCPCARRPRQQNSAFRVGGPQAIPDREEDLLEQALNPVGSRPPCSRRCFEPIA